MASDVRVRIAPSPTGSLHLGTARTALYNYLFARRHGGKFIMRLEDTDEVRSSEDHTKDILEGLAWLDLKWDEGPDIGGPYPPYRQTEKIDHYEKVAQKLVSAGKAYFCFCSQEELAQLKEEQRSSDLAPRYDNRCRQLKQEQIDKFQSEGRVPAIRFVVEEPRLITWQDAIRGEISIASSDLGGDMVIVKSNGIAIYNFAVVIDDIDMKMTHVIRGEDHIHNTAKQLLIYEALEAAPPVFAHAPLIFDMERAKLSKRKHGEAVHIYKYKKDGYLPEALINYLAQMSWTPPNGQEVFTLDEACKLFDLDKVSKSPAVFDIQRLNWFNSNFIRSLSLKEVTEKCMPYLVDYDLKQYDRNQLEAIVACVKDGLTTLSEIKEATQFFFDKTIVVPDDIKEALLSKPSSKDVLKKVLEYLPEFNFGDPKACKAIIEKIGAELKIKGKDLYGPVRAALCGKAHGPDLGSIISTLGKDRVRNRIENTLDLCAKT